MLGPYFQPGTRYSPAVTYYPTPNSSFAMNPPLHKSRRSWAGMKRIARLAAMLSEKSKFGSGSVSTHKGSRHVELPLPVCGLRVRGLVGLLCSPPLPSPSLVHDYNAMCLQWYVWPRPWPIWALSSCSWYFQGTATSSSINWAFRALLGMIKSIGGEALCSDWYLYYNRSAMCAFLDTLNTISHLFPPRFRFQISFYHSAMYPNPHATKVHIPIKPSI